MKILQVNCVYRKGSTGKIVYDIHTELQKQNIDSVVCYGRGAKIAEPNVYKVCPEWYSNAYNLWSRLSGVMYGGLPWSTRKLIRIIEKERPDVVHLHCINGYFVNIYRLVDFLKRRRIKTVLSLHAEFMHTANCGYALQCGRWRTGCGHCPRRRQETKSLLIDGTHRSWTRMKKAFEGFGNELIVTSVSAWLENRAKQSPILAHARHTTVMNGLDTGVFKRYGDEAKSRERFGLTGGRKIVFHATPSFTLDKRSIKGGYYVCELAKRMPEALFAVAGPHTPGIEVPRNVVLLGRISDQTDLARLYALADATLLTSERETFSMVTAESLCCGTPVAGFKAGGPESIALPEYSSFVEHGNVEALKERLQNTLAAEWNKQEISAKAKTYYDRRVMTNGYLNVYNELLKGRG